MEKRYSERKQVNIEAKINIINKSYDAFINNVSLAGVTVGLNIKFAAEEMAHGITPNTTFGITFQNSKAEEINLRCCIIWVNVSSDENVGLMYMVDSQMIEVNISSDNNVGIIYDIGSEIINPPIEYYEFLANL